MELGPGVGSAEEMVMPPAEEMVHDQKKARFPEQKEAQQTELPHNLAAQIQFLH